MAEIFIARFGGEFGLLGAPFGKSVGGNVTHESPIAFFQQSLQAAFCVNDMAFAASAFT
ncbi:MAG TPA: hypothetical protein VMI53_04285 [Opitutaceae bacterium]|nr:hypothetical protein [Opitutaceae bacterium]